MRFPLPSWSAARGWSTRSSPSRRGGRSSGWAQERELKNVRVLVTGGEDLSGIPTGEVDLAMSVSSFHHLADPRKALVELRRVVRQGGRVYVSDMKPGRVFRHGSRSDQFRAAVSGEFPNAEFEEGLGYIVAEAEP
jgi:ubiquinone/menaquinone biosynthesis C-methylase UbiE